MNQQLIEFTKKHLNIPHNFDLNLSDGTIFMNLLKLVNVNLPSLKQETKLIFKIQNLEVIKHYCKRYEIPFNYNIHELAGSSENSQHIQNGLLGAIILYVHDYSQYKLRGRGIQNQQGAPLISRNKENIPLNNQPESTNIQSQQFVYQTPQKTNYGCQEIQYQSAYASPIHQSQIQRNSMEASQFQSQNNNQEYLVKESIASVHGSTTKGQVQQEQIIQNQMLRQDVPRVGFQTQMMMNTPQRQFYTAQQTIWKNHSSQYFGSQESCSQIDERSCQAKRGQSIFNLEEIAEMINKKVDQLGCTEKFLPLLKEANAIAQNNLTLLYCFIIDILCTEEDSELLKMRYYLVQAYQIPQEYSQPFSYGQRIYN